MSKAGLKPEWRREGTAVTAGKKYEMTSTNGTHKLVVKNVDSDDDCQYMVVFKEADSTAKLNVKGRL